ncbi:MAG: LamG-like jellyroll fold domain-containing protein [Deltaproteobacteria bacterium]|nr:LamG-like jellyroll fold domain-containing protein [Deltaproteobacteria bacterium]
MKKYRMKILLVGLFLSGVACGHSETILPGFQNSSSVVSPIVSPQTPITPIITSAAPVARQVSIPDFELTSSRLNAVSHVSPLTTSWRQTFTREIKISVLEIDELYRSSVLDRIFKLSLEEQIDWLDVVPKIRIEPWFHTACRHCIFLKDRSLGSIKQFLTEEHTSPVDLETGTAPAVAYDPDNRNYIIVWSQDDGADGINIYARLVAGANGSTVRVANKKISVDRGTDACLASVLNDQFRQRGITPPDAQRCKTNVDPAVAYNNGHFLITWTKRGAAPAPQGESFSVILGQMVTAATLEAMSGWEKGIMLSSLRITSSDSNQRARNDSEIMAWSKNEHSALAPYTGSGRGTGSFALVWDATNDFTTCRVNAWRGATSIYGRGIPTDFNPNPDPNNNTNPSIFKIYGDVSTAQPQCSPDYPDVANPDVTRGRKPRIASLAGSSQFLTVFETYKNSATILPSISGNVVTLAGDLIMGTVADMTSFTPIDNQMHQGCFDPDVVATVDKFLVSDEAGHQNLKLIPVTIDRATITVQNASVYTDPSGNKILRPRITTNRIVGQEGGTHDFDLEYDAAYESRTPNGTQSQIQTVAFNNVLTPMEPKNILTTSFPINQSVAVASAEKKFMAVWNGVNGTFSRILSSVVTVNPVPNERPTAVIDIENHPEEPVILTSGDIILLKGDRSDDAEDLMNLASYLWQQNGGIRGTFENTGAVVTHYTAPVVSTTTNFTIQLVVTDRSSLASFAASKQIRVNPPLVQNNPPHAAITEMGGSGSPITTLTKNESLADPGWNQTRLILSGISSDDGETPPGTSTLSFNWEQVNVDADGANAIMGPSNNNQSDFAFSLPDVPKARGTLTVVIRLTVNDAGSANNIATQDLTITVNDVNHRPTAPVITGPANNAVVPPSRLALTWSASVDPDVTNDGDRLIYDVFWQEESGSLRRYQPCTAITATHCTVTDLFHLTHYRWRVQVRDSSNLEVATQSSAVQDVETGNNVLARWTFDEGIEGLCEGDDDALMGRRSCDASGNGHHATFATGSDFPSWVANGDVLIEEVIQGIMGLAWQTVSSPSHYAHADRFTISNTSQGSIELWVYPLQSIAGTMHDMFFTLEADAGGISNNHIRRILIQMDGNSGAVFFTMNNTNNLNDNHLMTSTLPLLLHRWNHLVCTFGPDGRTIYINGVSAGTSSDSFPMGVYVGDTILNSYSVATTAFLGLFDDVVVYSDALSPDAVSTLVQAH